MSRLTLTVACPEADRDDTRNLAIKSGVKL